MKPPAFRYARPATLGEALELVARAGGDAKVLAGGQSLLPLLNARLAAPKLLVDLNRVPDLAYVRRENGWLRVGALARHRVLETSAEARAAEPMLARAAREIGHLAIRTRGTIGGSLAHADPAGEWPLLAVALGATLTLRSAARERTVEARRFFTGRFTTVAAPDEIVTEVAFPAATSGGFGFRELSRHPGDFAVVAVACRVTVDAASRCSRAALAVGGADDVPLHVPAVDDVLAETSGEEAAIREAAEAAAKAVDPSDDVHASADYRRRMVAVFARRALREAFGRPEVAP